MKVPIDWKNALGVVLTLGLDWLKQWRERRKVKKEAEKEQPPQ